MRVTIIGCIVLLLSVLTVSQWPYMGGMGGMGGYGGFGGGFLQVPQPTYSYELPSSYSYTPAGVSLVGNTYTFTPPSSSFGAVATHNVNVTSPSYLNLPPSAFGGTGWNQGFGFGGQGGYGGLGGYNTMGFSPYANSGYPSYPQHQQSQYQPQHQQSQYQPQHQQSQYQPQYHQQSQYQPEPVYYDSYDSYNRYSSPPSYSRYSGFR